MKNWEQTPAALLFFIWIVTTNFAWAADNNSQKKFPRPQLLQKAAYSAGQDDFDVTHYELKMSINPATEWVDAELKMAAFSVIEGLDKIVVNLTSVLNVASVGDAGVGFTHSNDLLAIQLDRAYNEHESFTISIRYAGQPTLALNPGGLFFARRGDSWAVHSESCPWHARNWFPCKDVPYDKADSINMIITVPEDLVVASNGVLRSVRDNNDGSKTYHWHEGYPIATYLISIQITNYSIFQDWYVNSAGDSMPLINFAYPEHLEKAQIDWQRTAEMMEFFASLFGEYPFFNEKYGMVEYNAIWGGMENQTLTSIFDGSVSGSGRQDALVAHELSHQWWGDCVTMADWGQTWLNEGFAVYCESLWWEHVNGEEGYKSDVEKNLSKARFYSEPIYREQGSDVYDLIVYEKGACVLHMLRHILGDEGFFAMLPKYLQRFAYSNASTQDLQKVCEEIYGDYLDWFFEPWIYQPGYPHYAYTWESEDLGDGRFAIRGFVNQIQTLGPFFTMPVDITILAGDIDTTFVLFDDEQGEAFECILPIAADTVLLDRDHWILRDISLLEEHHQIALDEFEIDDSAGDGDGRADPAEIVNLVMGLKNLGTSMKNVSANLSCNDPTITILSDFAEYGDLGIAEHLSPARNSDSPFQFQVAENTESHLAAFHLQISADNGYSKSDSFFVKIGPTHIILVDDSGRRGYASSYQCVAQAGYINMDILPGSVGCCDTLTKYDIAIWCTGDSRENVIDADEQAAISSYLAKGGKLLLSGQDIGYDLVEKGSPEDTAFFASILHAKFSNDAVNSVTVRGESGDPIGDGLRFSFKGRYGAENQARPDVIEPGAGAYPILKYLPRREVAGIRYEHGDSRLVYLGFGLEGISGPRYDSAAQLLHRIIDWLEENLSDVAATPCAEHYPQDVWLYPNHPNPFNTSTTIQYFLPTQARVQLAIYNILGQKVCQLVDKVKKPGAYTVSWNAKDEQGRLVSGGLYSCKLITGKSEKMIKILFVP